MPKNSWTRRSAELLALSPEEIVEWLRYAHVTPKRARWIYERFSEGDLTWQQIRILDLALCKLSVWNANDTNSHPHWIKPFMWRELYKHKAHNKLGEIIAEYGYIFAYNDPTAASKLLDLYEEESAHPYTRGNVLSALLSVEVSNEIWPRLQSTIRHALNNRENAYARCTACMLATRDSTITTSDIEPLLEDDAGLHGTETNLRVKDYAQEAIEYLVQRNLNE